VLIPAPLLGQDSIRDWDSIARALVTRMSLTPGERVLLVGMPGKADSLVPALRAAVRRTGASDLGAIGVKEGWPEDWGTDFTRQLSGASAQALAPLLDEVDLAVMLPGATPADPLYAALQDRLRSGQGRTIHFFTGRALTLEGGEFDPLPGGCRISGCIAEHNHRELEHRAAGLRSGDAAGDVRVTTPTGTDLRFRIGERAVTRQDGDARRPGRRGHAPHRP
jgi:hypothetical protein